MKQKLLSVLFCILFPLSGCVDPNPNHSNDEIPSTDVKENTMTATVVERLPEYAVVSPVEGDLCSDEKVRVVYDEECRMSKADIETGDLVIITFWGGVNYVGRIDDAELPYINAMSWTKIECPQK